MIVEFIRSSTSLQVVIGRMNSALQMAKLINTTLMGYPRQISDLFSGADLIKLTSLCAVAVSTASWQLE